MQAEPHSHLAAVFAPLPPPAWSARAAAVQRVARSSIAAHAGEVAAWAPGSTGTVDGAVQAKQACGRARVLVRLQYAAPAGRKDTARFASLLTE